MKKIFKNLAFVALAFAMVAIVSCSDDSDLYDTSSIVFVQLENASAVSITENSGDVVTVGVQLSRPQNNDVTVNFDVDVADASRISLSPSNGSLTIPAGETEASLTLEAIDNDDIDGDVVVTLTLSESSDVLVGLVGQGIERVSKAITIVDDNVPCNDYTLTINTDFFANETHWYIVDSNGVRVQEDGNWVDGDGVNDGRVEKVYNFNLADGCYSFRLWDEFGDGQVDGTVTGNYLLQCGSLIKAQGSGALDAVGLPGATGADLPTGWTFQAAPTADLVGFVENTDFCVNQ